MIVHLGNEGAPEMDGTTQVVSYAALASLDAGKVTAWLIFAHLTWDRHKLSQNYGFDVAQRIRMEFESPAPIIFYSPIKEAYFARLNDVKYKLLNGCGTAFLETPSTAKAFDRVRAAMAPLSKTALLDVVTMLCNVRGWVVDRLNHDLKSDLASALVFSAVEPLLSTAQKLAVNFEDYRTRFSELDGGRNEKAFMDLRAEFIRACDALLPNDPLRKNGGEVVEEEAKQHVLLLEDDPTYRESIANALAKDFTVHPAATSKDAMDLLDQDKDQNKILAVICDWRLYEYQDKIKTERWQCPQGHSVLEYAATKGVRALYALTSQDDRLVHAMRNLSSIRYALFKKEHLTNEAQWQVLIDVLREGCTGALINRADRVVDKAKGWVNRGDHDRSKQEAYLEIWNSVDRETFFGEVTALADKAWRAYKMEGKTYLVGKFPDLEFSVKVNDRSAMKSFFALRRLYFAIWLDNRSAATDLTSRDIAVQRALWNTAASVYQRRNQLCINFKRITAERMFPEELAWLRGCGVDPDKAG